MDLRRQDIRIRAIDVRVGSVGSHVAAMLYPVR